MLDQFHHQFTDQLLGHNRHSDFIPFRKIYRRFSIRRYNRYHIDINMHYNSFHGILFILLVKHNFLRGFLHNQVIFEIQSNFSSFQFLAENFYKFELLFISISHPIRNMERKKSEKRELNERIQRIGANFEQKIDWKLEEFYCI